MIIDLMCANAKFTGHNMLVCLHIREQGQCQILDNY